MPSTKKQGFEHSSHEFGILFVLPVDQLHTWDDHDSALVLEG